MNLIPAKKVNTGNYWCTWTTQYTSLSKFAGGIEGVCQVRNNLNEEMLFNKPGVANKYFVKDNRVVLYYLPKSQQK